MQAVVLADRSGAGLGALGERAPVALIPLASRPVIVYAIEALATAGVRDVTVVASKGSEDIEQALGNGERWGLSLRVALTKGDEAPREVLRRLRSRLLEDVLVLRGDVFATIDLGEFAARARTHGAEALHAFVDGKPTGIAWGQTASALEDLAFVMPERPDGGDAWTASGPAIECGPATFSLIESPREMHRLACSMLDQRPAGVELPGREIAVGVRAGRHARVPLRAIHDQPVLVGARAEVDPRAEILDHVILGDDVVVDRGATLRRTVVLPGTYVGELVELENAIVWSNLLVRVDTGAETRITDAFLLADLRRESLASTVESHVHRALGMLLLFVSLPLWPLLALVALLADAKAPFQRVRLRGNRVRHDVDTGRRTRDFDLIVPATRIPWLRGLPGLLAVARGDLRLVGVAPLAPEQADAPREEWELVRDEAPAGWLAPSRIAIPADAPDEERLMMDAFYARTRTVARDAGWFLRGMAALFTRRAWVETAAR